MIRRLTFRCAISIGILVAYSAAARAEENEVTTRADALFREARALMKAGGFRPAREKLLESHELEPAPGTLINLATCQEELGELVAALRSWEEALGLLPDASDPRRTIAERRVTDLRDRIPSLRIELDDAGAHQVRVSIAGVAIARESLSGPIPLDPGTHEIVVAAEGRQPSSASVVLVEREHATRTIAVGAPNQLPSVEPAPAPPAVASVEVGLWPKVTVGSVGLAAAVAGTALHFSVRSDYSNLKNECAPNCDPEEVDPLRTRNTVALVLVGAGVTAAVGAFIWWLLDAT